MERKERSEDFFGMNQETPTQWSQDAMLAFLLLPGLCRDTLLKGRESPFWAFSAQMGEHLPAWWGLTAQVVAFV